MTSHVLEWLAAYHDGELTPNRQRRVEEHLQSCSTCRTELELLDGLSSLLKADLLPLQTPPQRFAAQVQLRLPHSARLRRNTKQPPRWVLGAPLVLIIVWAFLQSALWVTSFILTADLAVGQQVAFLNGWIASEGLLVTIGNLILLNVILLAGTAVLWGTWMAFWWAWKQNPGPELSSNQLQKEL